MGAKGWVKKDSTWNSYITKLQEKITSLKLDNELKWMNIIELSTTIWELEWENSFLKDKIGLYNSALKLYEWFPDQDRYIYMAIDSLAEMFCSKLWGSIDKTMVAKMWWPGLIEFKLSVLKHFREWFELAKKEFWL